MIIKALSIVAIAVGCHGLALAQGPAPAPSALTPPYVVPQEAPRKEPTSPRSTTINLYDANSQSTGYGRLDQRSGRIDFYDNNSQHTGYGYIKAPARRGRTP